VERLARPEKRANFSTVEYGRRSYLISLKGMLTEGKDFAVIISLSLGNLYRIPRYKEIDGKKYHPFG
jgi:hypothetical protein